METPRLKIGSHLFIKCNTCNLLTRHELKAVHARRYEEETDPNDPYSQPSWWIDYEYRLWACLGCDTAVFQEVVIPMDLEEYSEYYPSRKFGHISPKTFTQLDKKLQLVYKEVVEAYNTGLRVICGMGLRALLEGLCVNKGITDKVVRQLDGKLKKLKEYTNLPANIIDNLYSFKFIGDDAAHRLEAASREELKLAIEVMEDLLGFLYEVEYKLASKSQTLRNKRPPK